MFVLVHTMYPTDSGGIINPATISLVKRRLDPEMLDGEGEIVFAATAIAFDSITELAQMNVALHIIQI